MTRSQALLARLNCLHSKGVTGLGTRESIGEETSLFINGHLLFVTSSQNSKIFFSCYYIMTAGKRYLVNDYHKGMLMHCNFFVNRIFGCVKTSSSSTWLCIIRKYTFEFHCWFNISICAYNYFFSRHSNGRYSCRAIQLGYPSDSNANKKQPAKVNGQPAKVTGKQQRLAFADSSGDDDSEEPK